MRQKFDFYFLTIGWPAIWLALVCLACAGKYFDWRYRREAHEQMQFRWEGPRSALLFGVPNALLYFLLIGGSAMLFGSSLVTDFLLLALKVVIGSSLVLAAWMAWTACFERLGGKQPADMPSLQEVFQVKLDSKFQQRTQGPAWRKHMKSKAFQELVRMLTCGRGATKRSARVTPGAPEESEESEESEEAKKLNAQYKAIARERLGWMATMRVYAHALLISMTFNLTLKLTSYAWFLMRALIAVPLYCCVPRLFYLEWMVHCASRPSRPRLRNLWVTMSRLAPVWPLPSLR